MSITSRFSSGVLTIGLALASGCSTTQDKVHQFNAVPTAQVGSAELGPAKARTTSDLLRAADTEWRKANDSQNKGDHKGALRHYSQMLAYLSEADLNPAVFEGLREEFERILSSNSETADLFERDHPEFNRELASRTKPSDIFVGNILTQERVQAEIDEIVKRYPKNFQAGLDRSYKYRGFIEQEFAKAGLPKELMWLAMVESQFHPSVTSRAGAVGMWQFMPATGRRYGLRVDSYVDERRDWTKATRAAAAYLSDLYDFHNGAWPLAIASYNMGEGGISRMVAMNGGERDIWKLISNPPASDHMPTETKKFYPKLAASWIVATSPKSFGFTENPSAPEAVVTVPVQGSFSLAALERSAEIEGGTLKRLNPHLIRGVTPPSGEYPVVVPADYGEKFTAALASLAKEPRKHVANTIEGRTFHTVKRGDTLSKIAAHYGVDQKRIMEENKLRTASRIPVGKKLLIPVDARGDAEPSVKPKSEPEVPAAPKADTTPKTASTYKVKKGDTLFEIAQMHRVSLENLQKWNGLDRHARIRVNQELIVSESAAPSPAPEQIAPKVDEAPVEAPTKATESYTVKKGDTLAIIAKRHDMSLDELVELNGISKTDPIHVDAKLKVAKATESESKSAPVAPETKAPVAAATHKVQSGETLSGIAAKYKMNLSDLRELNGMTPSDTLKSGQTLKVRGESAEAAPSKPAEVAVVTPAAENVVTNAQEKAAGVDSHVVQQGETLSEIASKYKVKVSELIAWNNLGDAARLKIGQKLIVSIPKTGNSGSTDTAVSTDGKKTIHKVSSGQSPASIAKRYGVKVSDLFDWNKWQKDHVLHIDDEVIVYTK
ncbi:MAG TPA: LysM peptidoglycan-binding domain-containing protein [Candidatus Hydrogenedentes bacterium]|nr:LysM peptidoglycan-binding domain-containing protein [Candidatus Hydrogenedentota bacterium]